MKDAVKHIVKQSKTPAAESAPETASFERTPKAMLLGAVLVLLGGVLWGINATVSKLLMADYHADPLWIACVRELAAGALFLACAGVRTPKLLAGAVRDRRSYPMLLLAALTCVLFVQVSYLSAIDWTNSGTATVLQTLNLLFVLAYVCIRGRRWPGLRESIGVALAFAGTVLIATGGDLSTLKLPLVGLLWGLADAACTAALIVVAIILIVMARVASRRGNRVSVRGTAGGAIVAVVFAIMLTVAALLISNLFKDGIVKPSSPDKSPAQSAQNMQQSVEEAGIYCESGWSELSSQGYPGVTDVEICLKPRIAYVTFDNEFAADMYRAPLRYKIAEMFDEQANSTDSKGDWRLLSGKKWSVFSYKTIIGKLQKQWGGTVEKIG